MWKQSSLCHYDYIYFTDSVRTNPQFYVKLIKESM